MPGHYKKTANQGAHYCCHIINTLNDSSLGKQLILFPDTLKNIRIRNFEAGNPLNLAVTGVVGQHSRETVSLLDAMRPRSMRARAVSKKFPAI